MTRASQAVVGRERELAAVDAFLDSARGGAAAVLVGDAGIGKTTIWRAGIDRALHRGWRVLAARPGEQETRLGGAVLGDLLGWGARPGAPDDAADARAVLEHFRTLARGQPTLIAIDDVHWTDEASEAALRFAVRRLERDRVALLLTARGGLVTPLGAERRDEIAVGPLAADDLDAVIREHLGRAFLRPTVRSIHRASGGNPLFALELARALGRESATWSAETPLPVPTSLRALVGRRIDDLPGDVRAVLVAVAAAAQPTPAKVEAVAGDDGAAAIRTAVEHGVLEVDAGRLRFTHPLLQSIVYSDADDALRARVHRRLAAIARDPDERAGHLAGATRLPDEGVAAEIERAAARASARGRTTAAAWLLEESVRLTPRESHAALARRAIAAADACWDVGAGARAQALLDAALEVLPAGPERARALRRLARVRAHEMGFAAVSQLLHEALACSAGTPALAAAIERDLATTTAQWGSLDDASAHARRALALAQAIGNATHEREVRTHLAAIEFLRGRGAPADLEEALAAGDDATGESGFLIERMLLVSILKWTDRLDEARAAFEEMRNGLSGREAEGVLAPLTFQLAELECWAGNLDAAARYARESRDAAQRAGQRSNEALGRYVAALVAAWRGEVESAQAQARAGLTQAEEEGDVRYTVRNLKVIGFAELSVGAFERARAALARAYGAARAAGCVEPGFYRLEPDLIEAQVAAGATAEAERALADFVARAREPWATATAQRARALVLAGQGNAAAAADAATAAVEAASRLRQPLEHARALLVAGTLQRRVRQKRLAAEALDGAATLFESRGAVLWAQRARAERSRIGGRAASPVGLTPTERRVASLVAAGRANKEVAAELSISVKTVEANLSRIYRKLGLRSRTELAAGHARDT